MKLLFAPLGLAAGLLAGIVGRKAFERVWTAVDDSEPPHPDDREISVVRLAVALALEGAIFRLVKGLVDHEARRAFAGVTGSWPGERRPDPE